MHVNAFIDWISGTTRQESEVRSSIKGTPTFGGNFQAVSIAQKISGYVPGSLDFTPEVLKAIDFVHIWLRQVASALKAKNTLNDTLIVVASKHGQAPIDPKLYGEADPALLAPAIGVNVSFITTDDLALFFLETHTDTEAAVNALNHKRDEFKIADIVSGDRLTYLGYGDPTKDPAVLDFTVWPELGIIILRLQLILPNMED